MEQSGEDNDKRSFCFLPAARCSAERLVSVYGDDERERQLCRIRSLLNSESAERYFFALAVYKGQTLALLQLCREQKKKYRFRVRGLHCCRRFRNQGLATRLLQLAVQSVFELYQGEEIVSYILPANIPSLTAHKHAGFYPAAPQKMPPENHLCLCVRCNGNCGLSRGAGAASRR